MCTARQPSDLSPVSWALNVGPYRIMSGLKNTAAAVLRGITSAELRHCLSPCPSPRHHHRMFSAIGMPAHPAMVMTVLQTPDWYLQYGCQLWAEYSSILLRTQPTLSCGQRTLAQHHSPTREPWISTAPWLSSLRCTDLSCGRYTTASSCGEAMVCDVGC
jgi:hypothetical protein